jgi:hypothetical protein
MILSQPKAENQAENPAFIRKKLQTIGFYGGVYAVNESLANQKIAIAFNQRRCAGRADAVVHSVVFSGLKLGWIDVQRQSALVTNGILLNDIQGFVHNRDFNLQVWV